MIHRSEVEDILSFSEVTQGTESYSGVRVRPMTETDLRRILRLRTVVRWSGDPRSFELLRSTKEARWAVAEAADGAVIGMAGAVPLGRVGVLCHLAVHDEHRGLGLGGRLSNWAIAYLRSRGARTIRLYATHRAENLYRALGFRAVAPRTVYRLEAGQRESRVSTSGSGYRVGALAMGDLPEVYGLDLWTHGGDRSALIFATLRLNPGRGLIARDSAGSVKGYLVGSDGDRTTRIGPFVAKTPTAARSLLEEALRGGRSAVEVTVPGMGPAHDLLPELGFAGREDRLRMELGEVAEDLTPGIDQYGTTAYLAT